MKNTNFNNNLFSFNPLLLPMVIMQDYMRAGLKSSHCLIRLQMLGHSMIQLIQTDVSAFTITNIKKSSGYLSTIQDVVVLDSYLREIISRVMKDNNPISLVMREIRVGGYYHEEMLKKWLIEFAAFDNNREDKIVNRIIENRLEELIREIGSTFNTKHGPPCERNGRNFHVLSVKDN